MSCGSREPFAKLSPYAEEIEDLQKEIDGARSGIRSQEERIARLLLRLQSTKRLDAERQGHFAPQEGER